MHLGPTQESWRNRLAERRRRNEEGTWCEIKRRGHGHRITRVRVALMRQVTVVPQVTIEALAT